MRAIQLEFLRERVIWIFRSWLRNYPVPQDVTQWQVSDPENIELYGKEARAIQSAWKFLEPFFASRGYALYRSQPTRIFDLLPTPATKFAKPRVDPTFPYARRAYESDEEMLFNFEVGVYYVRSSAWSLILALIGSPYVCGLHEMKKAEMW